MAFLAPYIPALIEGGAAIYSANKMGQEQQAAQKALNAQPHLTPAQQHLADMLRTDAQQYLAPNYVQNYADQYSQAAQDAIKQATDTAYKQAMGHLAATGRSTGGAYNTVNADLGAKAAGLLANAKQQGLQLGQSQADQARALLANLSTNDINAARQQQTNLANLANQSSQNYASLAGTAAGLLADKYGYNPYDPMAAAGTRSGTSAASQASYLLNPNGAVTGAQFMHLPHITYNSLTQ